MESIPTFSGTIPVEEFLEAYRAVQCVWFQNSNRNARTKKRKRKESETQFLDVIRQAFQSATTTDQASWCIETKGDETKISPEEFLSPKFETEGYCSFVLQDDTQKAVSNFSHQVPTKLPFLLLPKDKNDDKNSSITTTDPYWIFVGRTTTTPLKGRPEHTDDIQHDGTFHYQCSGSKTWWIRPTDALREQCDKTLLPRDQYYKLTIQEGDFLVLNTRLWWHQTEIPSGTDCHSASSISISIARDIYLDGKNGTAETMSNQEGAWAVGFIPKGTKLLCEDDNPPMKRVQDKQGANCQLEALEEPEEGSQFAIVALKDIEESEFFLLWDGDAEGSGNNKDD